MEKIDFILEGGIRIAVPRVDGNFPSVTLPRSNNFSFVIIDDSLQSSPVQTLVMPAIDISAIHFITQMVPGVPNTMQGSQGCIDGSVRIDVLNDTHQVIASGNSRSDGSFGPIALPNMAGFIHLQLTDANSNSILPDPRWFNSLVPPVDMQGPTLHIASAQDPWDPSPGITGTAHDLAGISQVVIAIRDTSTNTWFGTAFDQTTQVWKKATLDADDTWHRMFSNIPWKNNIRYEIQCRADDLRGNSTTRTHAFTYTARAPAPPTDIAMTKLGDGQLWLTWTPNGHSNTVWIAEHGSDDNLWPEYKASSTDGIVRIDTTEAVFNVWVVGRTAEGDGHFASPLRAKPRHWIALSDPDAAPHAPAMEEGPCVEDMCTILQNLLGDAIIIVDSVFWDNAWVAIASNGALWFSPDDGDHWIQDTRAPETAYALVVEDVLIAVDMLGDVFALR
jgi:hypothetical protein